MFSFNSYVYYLTRGFIASARAFNLPTCAFNISTHAFSLLARGFELVTRALLFHYFRLHSLRDWICHDNTNILIWYINPQLTELGIVFFTQAFQV